MFEKSISNIDKKIENFRKQQTDLNASIKLVLESSGPGYNKEVFDRALDIADDISKIDSKIKDLLLMKANLTLLRINCKLKTKD